MEMALSGTLDLAAKLGRPKDVITRSISPVSCHSPDAF